MFFPDFGFNSYNDPFHPFASRSDVLRYKEMERRRHQQEMERRRVYQQQQQELERRKRMQERQRQLRLQQQREEEMERLQNEQLMRERRREQCKRDANAFPPGTIIRGRDGRLYRVVADPRLKDDDESIHSNGSVSEASVQSSSCSDSVQSNTDEMAVEHHADEKIKLDATANEFIPKDASKSALTKVTNDKPTKKKQFTLTVEDVPFGEDEELKDLHSVWRNRAPSPGEWMEPVDSFDK
jgi:hypothetical protein